MSKIVTQLLVHVSVQHKTALEQLKLRTGASQAALIEQAIEDLARKCELPMPGVDEPAVGIGQFSAPIQKSPALGVGTGPVPFVNVPPPSECAVLRPVTTKFVDWIMDAKATPTDLDDMLACLNDIPSEHGRFAVHLRTVETGHEIHLFEKTGAGAILRLANTKAAHKFMAVVTGIRTGKTSQGVPAQVGAVQAADDVVLF